MAMRNVARFTFGINRIMFRALNDDMSRPAIANMLGGGGPFDFSGSDVTINAVPLTIKIDAETAVTKNVNLSAALDESAVTVDELVTACTAAAFTGFTFSKSVADANRFKIAYSGAGTPKFVQVYGLCAKLALIGQGKTLQFIKSNTMKSFAETATIKEDVTISAEPATGASIDVITEGYKKGFTGTLIDTAEDFKLMEMVEGGVIDANGRYIDPHEESRKTYFEIFIFRAVYGDGSNLEEAIKEWEQVEYQKCNGRVGDQTFEAGFATKTYNVTGTNYTNGTAREGAKITAVLTNPEWAALDFDNL